MSVTLDSIEPNQFDAFLSTLSSEDVIAFDDLYVRYEPKTDTYEFETNEITASRLSESELHEQARQASDYLTNWWFWSEVVGDEVPHLFAFLRFLEDGDEHPVVDRYAALADGMTKAWGQLQITTTLAQDGARQYEIRHVDDHDSSASTLDAYSDPLSARDIGTFDGKGRYRPLRTAPSLPTGWVFTELSARDAYETVDTFYPATIANWYREHQGTLDIDHWRDTAERQTGIYGIIDELAYDAVEHVAATCCTDSQCLKRREWQYDEETPLHAEGGDGIFPCREPCSLVVAAARKWTTLEREETETYTFELTSSEKEQIEDIIHAVADDETDDIREADVYEGANRYRARFLREKRMDEHGHLIEADAGHGHSDHSGHSDHEQDTHEE